MLCRMVWQTNGWIKRRTVKGVHPNADEIWEYIKSHWPKLDAQTSEQIFQALK